MFNTSLTQEVPRFKPHRASRHFFNLSKSALNASVGQLPYLMGRMAVETAVRIKNGERVPLRQDVPLLLMTSALLQAGTHDLLKYVR